MLIKCTYLKVRADGFQRMFLRKFHISREMLLEVINNHKCLVQVIKPAVELVVDSASRQRVGLGRSHVVKGESIDISHSWTALLFLSSRRPAWSAWQCLKIHRR